MMLALSKREQSTAFELQPKKRKLSVSKKAKSVNDALRPSAAMVPAAKFTSVKEKLPKVPLTVMSAVISNASKLSPAPTLISSVPTALAVLSSAFVRFVSTVGSPVQEKSNVSAVDELAERSTASAAALIYEYFMQPSLSVK